jgi:hypothetical protein
MKETINIEGHEEPVLKDDNWKKLFNVGPYVMCAAMLAIEAGSIYLRGDDKREDEGLVDESACLLWDHSECLDSELNICREFVRESVLVSVKNDVAPEADSGKVCENNEMISYFQ